ncbi:MAG: metal ABC transporter substrate-binding protein [Fibromonadaceae bacterium]|jgi:zinc transport system substrate-binding protein|nr:metal ABC transporter substrate-binding protein [Fibromonadaceae bacterium]
MDKIAKIAIVASIIALAFTACGEKKKVADPNGKINVVATIFPLYDFSRAIAKEQANITMLTPPGSSIHSYEPSPGDIKNIQNADIFLYIGGENDAWVKRLLSALDTSNMKVVRLFDFVKLYEEEEKEGMQAEEEESDPLHVEGESEHGKLEVEYDEHIWTSPKNAVVMLNAIRDVLCVKDSANCEKYKGNAQNYALQIEEAAKELSQIVSSAKRKQIVVADRFPFLYLTKEYGLDYVAAFPGCSDQSDASVATIAFLIKTVKDNKVPYIYHAELSNRNTAEAVAEQTGAKMLLLHSYHNVSKQEFESGTTYLDLLKQNSANLKTGLLAE